MRRIENDATKYKQMLMRNKQMQAQQKPSQRQPTVLADDSSSITQIKSKAAKGDYKTWRKKAIADALKNRRPLIKYKELPREARKK